MNLFLDGFTVSLLVLRKVDNSWSSGFVIQWCICDINMFCKDIRMPLTVIKNIVSGDIYKIIMLICSYFRIWFLYFTLCCCFCYFKWSFILFDVQFHKIVLDSLYIWFNFLKFKSKVKQFWKTINSQFYILILIFASSRWCLFLSHSGFLTYQEKFSSGSCKIYCSCISYH